MVHNKLTLGEAYLPSPGGTYEITDLPLDTEIWVSAWWDKPGSNNWPDCGDYCGQYEANPITLTSDSANPSEINITLNEIQCGTISGTVTECNTDPPLAVKDIGVYAEDWEGGMRFYDWSDSEGHYTIQGIPTGNYRVCVDNHDTKYIKMCHDTPVSVTAGSSAPLDLCLEVGGTISGEIICDGCGGGTIEIFVSDGLPGQILVSTTINAPGPYTILGVPYDTEVWVWGLWNYPGSPHWWPDCGDYIGGNESPIVLTKDVPNREIDIITLEKIECVTISGTITKEEGGNGIQCRIDIWNEVGMWYSTETNENGSYSVEVPPSVVEEGDTCYRVKTRTDCAYVDEYYGETTNWGDATLVCATTDQPGIDISLHEGNHISGTIHLPVGGPGFNPGDLWFNARSDSTGKGADNDLNEDMKFCIALNPAYDYVLHIHPPDYTNYIEGYYKEGAPGNFTWRREDATPIDISTGDKSGIDITLQEGGSISGEILCENCNNGQIAVIALDDPELESLSLLGYIMIDAPGGSYTISGLPKDTQIWASAWWDKEQEWNPPPDCGDYVGEYGENPITLKDDEPDVGNINITLEEIKCGSISGEIICDEWDKGAIEIMALDSEPGPLSEILASTTIDSPGKYTICDVPFDTKVWVFGWCDKPGLESFPDCGDWVGEYGINPITLKDDEPDLENINITLDEIKCGSISGKVTEDPSGEAIEGVWVYVYDRNKQWINRYGSTNSDGKYSVDLPAGCYYIQTWNNLDEGYIDEWYEDALNSRDATLVCVEVPEKKPDIDFSLKAGGGSISGRVYKDDSPSEGLRSWVAAHNLINGYLKNVFTDESGNFIIKGLPSGKYYLFVNTGDENYAKGEIYNNAPTYWSEKVELIEVVSGGKVRGKDIGIPKAKKIQGNVTTDEGISLSIAALDPYFIPVVIDLSFPFVRLPGGNYYPWGSTRLIGSGPYAISRLHPDGSYRIAAWREDNGYTEFYNNVTQTFAAKLIEPSEDDDINFDLPQPGCIEGHIYDAQTSEPILDIKIGVYDKETGDLENIEYIGVSDSSGAYRIDNLTPDKTYKVRAFSCGSGYISQTSQGDITFGEGECAEVNFYLTESEAPMPDAIIGEGSGRVGDTVKIPLTIKNFQYQFPYATGSFLFDNDRLELSGFSGGDIDALGGMIYPLWMENLYGAFFGLIIPNLSTPPSGTLSYLDFKILSGDPGDEIPLEFQPLDYPPFFGYYCPCKTTDGKIIILPDISTTTTTYIITTTSIPECTSDADCDDGLFCNGAETCVGGRCRSGSDPCTDDGLFCNGEESCDEEGDVCLSSGDPCPDDGLFCTGVEGCDEDNDVCTQTGNPCTDPTPICDEDNDRCVGEPIPCYISIEPETAEVVSGQTLSFTITTEGDCDDPNYEWSVTKDIGSSIDQNGNYKAGINFDFSNAATDVVTVVDHGNGDITVEATVTVAWGCSLLQMYGEGSEEVKVLRSFRDNVLTQTPEGQELIRLYYEWSPAIFNAMEEDEEFKKEIKALVDKLLPLMRAEAE